MPFIDVRTNTEIPADARADLLRRFTEAVHTVKGDAVDMIACALTTGAAVAMAADSSRPAAVIHMTATAFTEQSTAALTRAFTAIAADAFGVSGTRLYVFFHDIAFADRYLVGWNGKTFKELRPDT